MNKFNSIKYFIDSLPGLAEKSWVLYFDFANSGQNFVAPRTGFQNSNGQLIYTGYILPQVNSFWQTSGVGNFDNNYIKIPENSGLIDFQNLSLLCVLKNKGYGGGTIFSTVCTGQRNTYDQFGNEINEVYFQGFEFGLTANNKLYYEYYDSEGIKVYTSDFYIPDKSSIFLNIIYGALSFGYYDFFRQSLTTASYNIDTSYILSPQNIYIARNPDSSGLYNYNKQLTAEMEQFLLFSPSVYEYEIQNFNSGFISNYFPSSQYTNELYSTGIIGFTTGISGVEIPITGYLPVITGYETGIVGYETGITGAFWTGTGVYLDEFGNSGEAFGYVDATGIIELTGLIPLTGISVTYETGTNEAYIVVDTSYLNLFGNKNINLLTKVENDDLVDIELINNNSYLNIEKNLTSFYDGVDRTFVFEKIRDNNDNKNYIVFVNGQLVNSGESIITGSIYSNGYLIFQDYIIKNKGEIFFNNTEYNENYNIFSDFLTGNIHYIENFNVNTGIDILNTIPNLNQYNLFINGQKLLSDFHYQISNNEITFYQNTNLYSGITGKMLIVPKNFNYSLTGKNQNLYKSLDNFYNNYSQVYKNGIRQTLNYDYLEISDFTPNTGTPILDFKNNLIYNNQNLFNN